ncbi:hypothetical protein K3495_g11765 [Podosphaera aphanis]|nr:hypothetical protein K3495_g11765 [Podosphaera aphanis]
MVQAGLEYGCIWTGKATIYLREPEDANTIFYHLSIPKEDECPIPHVSLTFREIIQKSSTGLRSGQLSPASYCTQPKHPHGERNKNSDPETSDELFQPRLIERVSCDSYKNFAGSSRYGSIDVQNFTQEKYMTECCTHKCLRELKFGGPLDPACPNSKEHGKEFHEINQESLLDLVRRQLADDLDNTLEQLDKSRFHCTSYKVRLVSHGYTLFAKFVPKWYRSDLQHKVKVYDRLEPLQGIHFPVHLGNFDLEPPYFYHGYVMLVHMMLLSYRRLSVMSEIPSKDVSRVILQAKKAYQKVHQLNVYLRRSDFQDIFLNHNTGQVVVTNFDCAALTLPNRNKKKRSYGTAFFRAIRAIKKNLKIF